MVIFIQRGFSVWNHLTKKSLDLFLFIESASSLPSSADGPLLNDKGAKAVFTFYIKANGRHTASLYQIAESGDISCLRHMRISRPLGKSTIDMAGRNYGDFEVVVLVAEGIGITPWISVLQQLGRREHHVQTKHIVLIWSIRSAGKLFSIFLFGFLLRIPLLYIMFSYIVSFL